MYVQRKDAGFKPPIGFPSSVLEVLRFCIVVFLAGFGYQIARGLGTSDVRLGPFDADSLGILIGAGLGYVLGGVVGRLTARSVQLTEVSLAEKSAEQMLAGMTGAVLGTMLAGGLVWPVLLVGSTLLTLPIFLFVCVTLGSLGYRLGLSRREAVLDLVRQRTQLAPRPSALASLPRLIDTSVLIDGRIVDVVAAGFLHGECLVTEPVLGEIQAFADSGDDARRAKGRRALDVLDALKRQSGVHIEVISDEAFEVPEVDAKLVRTALDRGAALLTLDVNLAKVAALAGCQVMNLHALAMALRPPVAAGETIAVLLTRAGKEQGQGVGYLGDGTMVIVEKAHDQIGRELPVLITSVLLTANGRLVFGRVAGAGHPAGVPQQSGSRGAGVASPKPGPVRG